MARSDFPFLAREIRDFPRNPPRLCAAITPIFGQQGERIAHRRRQASPAGVSR
jgi:hypothetical protein